MKTSLKNFPGVFHKRCGWTHLEMEKWRDDFEAELQPLMMKRREELLKKLNLYNEGIRAIGFLEGYAYARKEILGEN